MQPAVVVAAVVASCRSGTSSYNLTVHVEDDSPSYYMDDEQDVS